MHFKLDTGGLYLVCGRPTLAFGSALKTLSPGLKLLSLVFLSYLCFVLLRVSYKFIFKASHAFNNLL